MSDKGSKEFFYEDAKGRKQDSDLHEDMLNDGEDQDAQSVRAELEAQGTDKALLDRLYGSNEPGEPDDSE